MDKAPVAAESTMPTVRLISHASVVLESGNTCILTDPWLFGTCFNESWRLIAAPAKIDFDRIDYLWISHEHPDHFHVPTLKLFPTAFKQRVNVLFQKSCDYEKMVAALNNLGFRNITLLANKRWVRLSAHTKVLCYQSRQMDSALAVHSPDGTILNLNDCDFGPSDLLELRRLTGAPDVLLNQFSIAGFDGFEEEVPQVTKRILDDMVTAHRLVGAKVTIPFASFAYFCREDNAFLNTHAITPSRVAERFQAEGLNLAVLRPGQALGEVGDSVSWWETTFACEKHIAPVGEASLDEIQSAFHLRALKLKTYHGKWLWMLNPLVIDAKEFGKIEIDFARGVIRQTNERADILIAPEPLLFMLRNDFGLQTLGVSGRYRLLRRTRTWLLLRIFYAMQNAGIGLSLYRLFTRQQLRFIWTRRTDIFRQVAYTLGHD